ncbi:MAG TPA: ABC transporter ATP-binding protein [Ignavibacteriales bacterium]|nr:ABC transporter ATP-binding protein [Ignavibacteriales bacterium]
MNAIEVNNLTRRFGNFIAVKNISFSLENGKILGFLGANGAGKTTTIKILTCLLEPTSGDANIVGYNIFKESEKIKQSIGYMSQKFSLYDDLTVKENIDFFASIYGLYGRELNIRRSWVLQTALLSNKENILTKNLPNGIKQRLALSIAVIHKPKIIFLDEPTSGVDPLSRRAFWDLINELADSGITIFVTTHYLEEAEFCNKIIIMDAGEIIAYGSQNELRSKFNNSLFLEINNFDLIKFNNIIKTIDFVENIFTHGVKFHISIKNEGNNLQKIENLLKLNNPNVIINKISPSLEDIFIAFLNKRNENN